MPYLCRQCSVDGVIPLVYELNGPIRCTNDADRKTLKDAWIRWKTGQSLDQPSCSRSTTTRLGSGASLVIRPTDRGGGGSADRGLEVLPLTICSRAQPKLGGQGSGC